MDMHIPIVQLTKVRKSFGQKLYNGEPDYYQSVYRLAVNGEFNGVYLVSADGKYWHIYMYYYDGHYKDTDLYRSQGYPSRQDALENAVYCQIHGHYDLDRKAGYKPL